MVDFCKCLCLVTVSPTKLSITDPVTHSPPAKGTAERASWTLNRILFNGFYWEIRMIAEPWAIQAKRCSNWKTSAKTWPKGLKLGFLQSVTDVGDLCNVPSKVLVGTFKSRRKEKRDSLRVYRPKFYLSTAVVVKKLSQVFFRHVFVCLPQKTSNRRYCNTLVKRRAGKMLETSKFPVQSWHVGCGGGWIGKPGAMIQISKIGPGFNDNAL